jgi:hypothetical protein
VRPLLRTRTSCPLHCPAAACSSVRAVVHKVCGQCEKDPPVETSTEVRTRLSEHSKAARSCRTSNAHLTTTCYTRLFSHPSRIASPAPLNPLPTYCSRTVLRRSDNKVQPYPKATTRFLLPTTLTPACIYTSGTLSIDDAAKSHYFTCKPCASQLTPPPVDIDSWYLPIHYNLANSIPAL